MLKNINEETWKEVFKNYTGELPNESSSEYSKGLVCGFINFVHINGYTMKHIRSTQAKIKDIGNKTIKSIDVDIDEEAKIAKFKIILKKGITETAFKNVIEDISKAQY